jgi:DNA-binding HxlR family transcriptional regulator
VTKRYDDYCPVAHALGLVGERWALLVVLELFRGPKRYTDLAENLRGIGTNILASRLRDLEAAGVVAKRTLPPPAASKVYELTDYGHELRPVIRELALWGARSLGPPTHEDELFPGWLANALDTVLAPRAPLGRFEFRVGEEVSSLVDGEVLDGPVENPAATRLRRRRGRPRPARGADRGRSRAGRSASLSLTAGVVASAVLEIPLFHGTFTTGIRCIVSAAATCSTMGDPDHVR